jgi:AcrR family transcriptional regulator
MGAASYDGRTMSLLDPDHAVPDLNALPGARLGRDPARAIKRGPSQFPPEVVQATQRSRLLDGLVHTVAEKGYADARVSDICQAAGVTRPAFYALFRGKDDAFVAAYKHGVKVLFALMDQAHAAAPDWHGGAHEALRVLLDVLASVPAFATTAVVEVEAAGPAGRQERSRMLLRCGRYFAAAPCQPELPHGEDMVMAVVGGIHAAIYRYVAHDRITELPRLLPTLSYFATAPFLGDAAARRGPSQPHPMSGRTSLPCVSRPEHGVPQSLGE